MGSKTLEDDAPQHNDGPSPNGPNAAGGEARGAHLSRDGDGCLGSKGAPGDDGDDDDDDDESRRAASPLTVAHSTVTVHKKKRNRPKKKKNKNMASVPGQSSPPRIPLHDLFPSGNYPAGELLAHHDASATTHGIKGPELRHDARPWLDDSALLDDYRQAAEVHRQVRKWVQQTARPGQALTDLAVGIEDAVRALVANAGLEPGHGLRSGMAFPTGLSLNDCVAHYTPNPGHKDLFLEHHDVLKVDFGVHVNGWIVDSAFTMAFDSTYDSLLAAVRDATNTGIATAGIDVRICDVSAAIQEVMESYEVEVRGKTFPVRPVRGICAHDIKQYRIHGGKSIPFVKNSDQTKMEQGEIFAIETFGTTGRGRLRDDNGIYGYGMRHNAAAAVSLPLNSANRLYRTIKENFGSLVFCRRYLERLGCQRYLAGLNCLVSNGILESYQPLMDIPGSYSAQFEHTILLRGSNKEVISRGDDY